MRSGHYICVLVPDYINAHTILQHTFALSSELIAHKGLQGAPILEYSLHYKDNLTAILCFHASKILYVITMNMRIFAHKKNIMEHCNDLQNWHQGIECHSGCN